MYSRMESGSTPTGFLAPAGVTGYAFGGLAGATTAVSSVDNWAIRFRAHKDFYP
jgi:hypothetical protein